jgi:hypothetical protein
MCSRVIVIDKGQIVANDATTKLLTSHSGGTLEAVFRSLTRPEQAPLQSVSEPVTGLPPIRRHE